MTGLGYAVTRLRDAVTRKSSTGAGSYAVTRLRASHMCVRAQVRMRVRAGVRVRRGRNRVTA